MPNSVHRLIPSAVLITAYTSPVGQSLPYLESFTIAQRSVRELQALIRRRPKIDVFSSAGKKPKAAIGNIEFRDVHFNYRTRPTVKVRQSKYPEVYISLLELAPAARGRQDARSTQPFGGKFALLGVELCRFLL